MSKIQRRKRYFGTVDVTMPWPVLVPLPAEKFMAALKTMNPEFDGELGDLVQDDVSQLKNWPQQKSFKLRFADTKRHAKGTAINLEIRPGIIPAIANLN